MKSSPINHATGFDWDEHTADKNRNKYGVEAGECEEVFFNQPLLVVEDSGHSPVEVRYHALGKSDAGRGLLVVSTLRDAKIRVISARGMSRKERGYLKKKHRDIPAFADEDEEALFWQTHDSTDYVEWNRAQATTFPALKPSLRSISLRLPEPMLARLRTMANERDVRGFQSPARGTVRLPSSPIGNTSILSSTRYRTGPGYMT